ncbi:ABC transporter ATP-binding protein [Oceanospirillum sediminis]|uniref:ABC transporter ATP-binding protein n=1 Tax=Oceanospirillum sediminis TaxID=2760088 RepID=A0A839IN63_9GAMM|nr:ABC transporter ATP-binding protein [Oceanospirillum sediminis]MBB1486140.1 ABC transporter ATP-binding protein [Oceanospirillum sediminis]
MSYVEVTNLAKRFDSTPVFKEINFTINKGEFITLLGPSGCGKSTLLRCIAGLNSVDNGSILVDGEDITSLPAQRRGIAMVFQSYALFPNMTVTDNIAFGLKMQKLSSDEIQRRVREGIEMVELNGREDHYPHQLSGGQRQRVALARSLVMQPRILLLDEPLSALDAKIRKNLREQIRLIQQELNLTTIFVTHDQEEALTMSDRIFLMNSGQIVQSGSAEEIYTEPADAFVASFIGNYNLLQAEQARAMLGLDTQLKVAIRPESILISSLSPVDTRSHYSQPISGTVKSSMLLGNVIRYRMDTDNGELVVDLLNRSSERLVSRGTQLELQVNMDEVREVA